MDTIEKTRIADNRESVRAFIDALFTKRDLTAVDVYLAEDFLNHDPPVGSGTSREGMRRAGAGALFRGAFPDWHSTTDFLVAENDMVVELQRHRHSARRDLRPTGRTVTLRGINIFRLREGRIVERWAGSTLGLLRRLGLAQARGSRE
ncbi:ester cyclase [Kitasatospora sp. NPDC050543]|uniref:ester cyclase n=1 Tax=Kitasatospora sp. NPDC050543 TaxID=3364054 RepID=UPI0037AB969F